MLITTIVYDNKYGFSEHMFWVDFCLLLMYSSIIILIYRGDKMKKKRGLEIFISYSHRNMRYKNKLLTSLEALRQSYYIEPWHDGMIGAGANINEDVKKAINQADIILLLITDDYLSSYYCMQKELKIAKERENRNECKVIPVMFQESILTDTLSFFYNNRIPEDGTPIATGFRNQSQGCTRAVRRIQQLLDTNFPKYKKKVYSESASDKTTKKEIQTSDSLSIQLYTKGILTSVPIDQNYIDLLPKYHKSIVSFSIIMGQSLSMAKDRYRKAYRKNKGNSIPPHENLQLFRMYLMDICAYTKAYITGPIGVKVHFRISKDKNYLGLIASTDDGNATDLSCDWTLKMTPIPIYRGLVYHSSRVRAPLIKSLNSTLSFKCKNSEIWKDYMTYTFRNILSGQTPLISYCISIHKDYYKIMPSMLKILAFLNFGELVEQFVIDYCNTCKDIDKNFNLEDIIKAL